MREEERAEYDELKKKYDAHFGLANPNRGPELTKKEKNRFHYLCLRENRDLRNKYGPFWDWLNNLLYRHDLEHLCGPDGAPYDEYESEVECIAPRLVELYNTLREENTDPADVEEIVRDVFQQMFHTGRTAAGERTELSGTYPDGYFDAVAEEITDFLNSEDVTINIESIGAIPFIWKKNST